MADWKITNILNGEYICDKICRMEYQALDNLKKSLPGLISGEINAYEELMYGLLLSGLAMQMTGNSRPASGAEHHMAHFWEMAVIHEELCESIKKINIPNLLDTVAPEKLKERTEEIVKLIEEIPTADTIRDMLGIVHGVTGLSELGLEAGMKEKTARIAPYIRDRLTFLRMLKYYNFYDKVI